MLNKYRLHLYATYRLPFDITAISPDEAMEQLRKLVDKKGIEGAFSERGSQKLPEYADDFENDVVVDRRNENDDEYATCEGVWGLYPS